MPEDKQNGPGLDPEITSKLKEQAQELVEQVNAGEYARAMTLINDLSEVRDQSLYREVGRLTRSLHEALRNLQIHPQNPEQQEALSKMSDASERLEYVVEMTGNAANRTMDLVEDAMPRASAMCEQARTLREDWQRLRRREMEPSEFRELYGRIDRFLENMAGDAEKMYADLSEILLAQGFQDLTGQVIQKVTALVREVEENLVSLVVMASHVDQLTGTIHDIKDRETSLQGEGPQLRAAERSDVVSGQDDVDDLLSSLGF